MKRIFVAGPAVLVATVITVLTSPAQAQTSPSQYAYNRALEGTARAHQIASRDPTITRRCDELMDDLVTTLAKSECERRDTVTDDAPAGMTPAIRERKQRLRAQALASYGEPLRY